MHSFINYTDVCIKLLYMKKLINYAYFVFIHYINVNDGCNTIIEVIINVTYSKQYYINDKQLYILQLSNNISLNF